MFCYNVREGTDEILETVKLYYIYRWSHLFYMCLHLWREPEFQWDVFHRLCIILLSLSVIHFEFNIFFLFLHPAVRFESVYRLVAEDKIIHLEDKWSHKESSFLAFY